MNLNNGVKGSITDARSHIADRMKGLREKSLSNHAAISQKKLVTSSQSHSSIDTQTTATNTTMTSLSEPNTDSLDQSSKGKISHTSFLKEWMEKVEKDYGVRPQKGSEVNEWDSETQKYEKEVLHRVMERTKAKVNLAPFPGIEVVMSKNMKAENDLIEDPPCLNRVSSTNIAKGDNQYEDDFGVNISRDHIEIFEDRAVNDDPSEFKNENDDGQVLMSEVGNEDFQSSLDSCYLHDEDLDKVKSINQNESRLEQFLSHKKKITFQSTSFSSLANSSRTDSDLLTTYSWESSTAESIRKPCVHQFCPCASNTILYDISLIRL